MVKDMDLSCILDVSVGFLWMPGIRSHFASLAESSVDHASASLNTVYEPVNFSEKCPNFWFLTHISIVLLEHNYGGWNVSGITVPKPQVSPANV